MADDLDDYTDNYEIQIPIIVVTHKPPGARPKENDRLTFTFVTDGIEPAVALATAAPGDRAVTMDCDPSTTRPWSVSRST